MENILVDIALICKLIITGPLKYLKLLTIDSIKFLPSFAQESLSMLLSRDIANLEELVLSLE